MIDPNTAVEAAIASVTACGGLWTGIRHISTRSKRKREELRQEILKEAKQEADKVKSQLEAKISALDNEFKIQKTSVSKDFETFKQIHNSEIKVLGEKIESLRQDIADQHQALVQLLTRLVDSR
jgi:hypothetical protein